MLNNEAKRESRLGNKIARLRISEITEERLQPKKLYSINQASPLHMEFDYQGLADIMNRYGYRFKPEKERIKRKESPRYQKRIRINRNGTIVTSVKNSTCNLESDIHTAESQFMLSDEDDLSEASSAAGDEGERKRRVSWKLVRRRVSVMSALKLAGKKRGSTLSTVSHVQCQVIITHNKHTLLYPRICRTLLQTHCLFFVVSVILYNKFCKQHEGIQRFTQKTRK
eukprot:TRINITY_DN12098_c0_g1_i3.p1 TRINITY_DN12098_c0_g1~~TRINITY_DN12098_c0_g1_i3.p1  ORF type:complete len:226 (-),score=-7.44 TRINITY_DN12098_c0_g1_i3:264-941(-)